VTENEYTSAVKKISTLAQRSIEERFEIGALVDKVLKAGWSLRGLSEDTGIGVDTLKAYQINWKAWGDTRIPGCTRWETYTFGRKNPKRKSLLLKGVSYREIASQEIRTDHPEAFDPFLVFAGWMSHSRVFESSLEDMVREGASYEEAVRQACLLVEFLTELGLLVVPSVAQVEVPVDNGGLVPAGRLFRRSRRAA
jgi:hypothetical protein